MTSDDNENKIKIQGDIVFCVPLELFRKKNSRSKKGSNFFVLITLCTYVTKLKKKEKKQQARKVDKNLLFIYKRSLNIIGLFFSFKFLLFFYYIHFLSVCT